MSDQERPTAGKAVRYRVRMSPPSATRVPLPSCSAFSFLYGEPLAGTAPTAATWLAIEQPGSWGARALTESHFDPELGAELNRRAQGTGVRISMIRRVGRHTVSEEPGPRTVLIASTLPGRSDFRSLTLGDPRELLDLDFAALGAGRVEQGDPHPGPALLVCTNGKRDKCCAVVGRSLALSLAELHGGVAHATLWETDHLGGHRFAPTALVLPGGYLYGRLDVQTALLAAERAAKGEMSPELCRGRSTWSRVGQAADLALRTDLALYAENAVDIVAEEELSPGLWAVTAFANDVEYRILVEQTVEAVPRPESCGKTAGTPTALHVVAIERAEEPVRV
jgi:hypothetical protein